MFRLTVSIFFKYNTVKCYYVMRLYNASMITLGKTHLKLAIRGNPWFRDKIKFLLSGTTPQKVDVVPDVSNKQLARRTKVNESLMIRYVLLLIC